MFVSLILFFLNYGNKDREKTGTSKIKSEILFFLESQILIKCPDRDFGPDIFYSI